MTIYDLPSITKEALSKPNTPQNIDSGFNKFEIFSYNPEKFQDHDFAPSFATNRDASQDVNVLPSVSVDPPISADTTISTDAPKSPDLIIFVDTTASTDATMSADPDVAGSSLNSDAFSLLRIKKFPKACSRTEKRKRNFKKSSILKDTSPKKKVAKEKRRQACKTREIAGKKKQSFANNKRKSHVPTNK